MNTPNEFLQLIGLEDKPLLKQFIEEIANKKLRQYQKIIQWGGHNGQSLYAHAVSGVFLILSLEKILKQEGVTDTEFKILVIAFCIHDLNKNYNGKARHYGDIAISENVSKEIEAIGFDNFLEDWQDYLEDITEIIRGHSGHNSVRGDSLDRRSDSTKLGKKRLTELCHIIRAADVADLSQNYSEQKHKQTFLSHLNRFTKCQYRLITHKLSEQRGILTNVIHNQVAQYLSDKFQAISIFSYPQGTYYLVAEGTNLNLDEQDINKISESVENTIREMKYESYAEFFAKPNQGIKFESELLQLGIEYEEIWGYINTLIQKKTYNISEFESKCRGKLKEKLNNKKEEINLSAQYLLKQDNVMPNTDDLMRLGELLRTFYIFLSDHCKDNLPKINNKKSTDPWLYIYQWLDISDHDLYCALDSRYHQAYVIAKNLKIDYEHLLEKTIKNAQSLLPIEVEKQNLIMLYVKSNLSFNFVNYSQNDFAQHLINYCQNNHQQSCYSSSEFISIQWKTTFVPDGIKVNQFSNFLRGGDNSEPKRYVDPIIKEQFFLENLNFSSSGGDKYLYLHLMPYSFMTAPFMESFKRTFEDLKTKDVSAVSFSIQEAINYFKNENYYSLPIDNKGKGGILVPQFSEVIGNVITLPVTTIGDNKTEKYLNAVEYTLLIHKYFGLKALLSESSIPIMDLTEHSEIDIFLDGVPSILKGLIPSEKLRFRRNPETENLGSGDILWQRLTAVREIHDLLHIKRQSKQGSNKKFDLDELFTLAKSFSISDHRIFFEIDRLIEKKVAESSKKTKNDNKKSKDWIAIELARKLKLPMEQIMTTRN